MHCIVYVDKIEYMYLYFKHGFCDLYNLVLQLSEKIYKTLDTATRLLRFTLPFPMLAYPFYLVGNLLLTFYCLFYLLYLCYWLAYYFDVSFLILMFW